jgi:hypothetical protein
MMRVPLVLVALLIPTACSSTSSGVTVASVGRTSNSAPPGSVTDATGAVSTSPDTAQSTPPPAAAETIDLTDFTLPDNFGKVEFTSPEGDFVVSFPGEPKSIDTPVSLPDGSKVSVTSYAVERGDGAFLVAFADYPVKLVNADPTVVLEGARDGALQNVQGTLATSAATSLGAVPGIAFTGTMAANNGVLTSRIFLDGVRLYQVFSVGDAASSSLTADTAAFLDSFKLTKAGG